MKVLVTGSKGFIGKNLLERLGRMNDVEIVTFSKDDAIESLASKITDINFIFHLAESIVR